MMTEESMEFVTGADLSHTKKLALSLNRMYGSTATATSSIEIMDYAAQTFIAEVILQAMHKPTKKSLTESDVLKAVASLGYGDLEEAARKELKLEEEVKKPISKKRKQKKSE